MTMSIARLTESSKALTGLGCSPMTLAFGSARTSPGRYETDPTPMPFAIEHDASIPFGGIGAVAHFPVEIGRNNNARACAQDALCVCIGDMTKGSACRMQAVCEATYVRAIHSKIRLVCRRPPMSDATGYHVLQNVLSV